MTYAPPPPQPTLPQGGPAPFPKPAPGTDLGSDLGAALGFAWNALLRNWVPFLVAGLIYSVIAGVILFGGTIGGMIAMFSAIDTTSTEAPPLGTIALFYGIILGAGLLSAPFLWLWQSGTARAAETVLDGGRPTLGQAMAGPFRIILTMLLVGVITVVGFLLLYIPGLIASVLLMFAIPAAARGASPVEAITQSISLARNNLGTTIVAYLVLGVIGSIGGSLIITVIAVVPFLVLFEIGMFERLNGRNLPEPARA